MDTNISANTLFHFTPRKESLLNILENGLYVRYSLENFNSLMSGKSEIVFPMVSFCDIPLSHVKRHVGVYGKYAIGLTKEWGMRNKINPVIYAYPNSTTADILNDIKKDLKEFFDIEEPESAVKQDNSKKIDLVSMLNDPNFKYRREARKKVDELQNKLSHFIRYIKPYEGKFYRHDKYLSKEVKFYDEREWRFTVPKDFFHGKSDIKDSYKSEYYTNPIRRRAINIKLAKYFKLEFKPGDIRFIIVEKESEIPDMLDKLENIFGDKASYKEMKLLVTRIISLEQILEDL